MSDLIDKQQTIDAVAEALRGLPVVCTDIAKETIEQLPPAQPEIIACGEGELFVSGADVGGMIDRQAAIDALRKMQTYKLFSGDDMLLIDQAGAQTELMMLPPAQPERIKGRWVEKPHVHGVAYCSLCDYELHTNDTNFCPNCGAKMEVNNESN